MSTNPLKFINKFITSQSPYQRNKAVAQDTIERTKAIIEEHAAEGATIDSTFLTLDKLLDNSGLAAAAATAAPKCPEFPPSKVEIVNSDAFTLARKIMAKTPDARGKIAVLNLASDEHPGGGWEFTLSKTQEEALCYSSTLYGTLKPEYYPWPNIGPGSVAGIYSPGVVIFKNDLDHDCVDLDVRERRVVSVITVAAPACRPLTEDKSTFKDPSVLDDLRGKIRLVYKMAAHHGQQYLVLGAMGCGAYRCPPDLVAREMKAILENEFHGWFRQVVFAVYSKGFVGDTNFEVFSSVFSAEPSASDARASRRG